MCAAEGGVRAAEDAVHRRRCAARSPRVRRDADGAPRRRRGRGVRPWALGLAALLLGAGLAPGAGAQTLDDLKAPGSPAFVILGIEPTSIERPTTPHALGLSLLSTHHVDGVIPESYALEVTPYWLTPKPWLSFRERYDPSLWQSVKQSLALSLATVPVGTQGDSVRLGAGARVLLLPGRPARSEGVRVDSLVKDSLNTLQRTLDDLLEAADTASAAVAATLRAAADSLEQVGQRLGRELASMDSLRSEGVRWELAGAVGAFFPGSLIHRASLTAWGLWSTVSFRPTAENVDVLGAVRLQHLDLDALPGTGGSDAGSQKVLDGGVRMIWTVGSLLASGEVMLRQGLGEAPAVPGPTRPRYGTTWRTAAHLEYHVAPGAAVTWTLGKGFALQGVDDVQLIALLGVKLGVIRGLDLPF